MRDDVRLLVRGMEPVCCSNCTARVEVRKSGWEQTIIQWDAAALGTCRERRATDASTFPGCAALRRSIADAAMRGDLVVED